jgi:hypothetical protein
MGIDVTVNEQKQAPRTKDYRLFPFLFPRLCRTETIAYSERASNVKCNDTTMTNNIIVIYYDDSDRWGSDFKVLRSTELCVVLNVQNT